MFTMIYCFNLILPSYHLKQVLPEIHKNLMLVNYHIHTHQMEKKNEQSRTLCINSPYTIYFLYKMSVITLFTWEWSEALREMAGGN